MSCVLGYMYMCVYDHVREWMCVHMSELVYITCITDRPTVGPDGELECPSAIFILFLLLLLHALASHYSILYEQCSWAVKLKLLFSFFVYYIAVFYVCPETFLSYPGYDWIYWIDQRVSCPSLFCIWQRRLVKASHLVLEEEAQSAWVFRSKYTSVFTSFISRSPLPSAHDLVCNRFLFGLTVRRPKCHPSCRCWAVVAVAC